MKDNIKILVKYYFKSQFSFKNIINYIKNNKGMFFGMIIVFLYAYSVIFFQSFMFVKMDLGDFIPVVAFLVLFISSFISSFLKSRDELYNFKNRDNFLTYPIEVLDIVKSRLIILYLFNLILSSLIIAPFIVVYFIFIDFSVLNIINWIVLIFITSIIPICISIFINTVLTRIVGGLRNNNYLYNLLSMVLIIGTLVGSFYFSFRLSSIDMDILNINLLIKNIMNNLINILLPLKWIKNIFDNGNMVLSLVYIFISVIVYYFTVKFVNYKYLSININSGRKHRSSLNISKIKRNGVLKALYIKDFKTYANSRIYATNTFVGTIMLILLSISIMVIPQSKIMSEFNIGNLNSVYNIYPYIGSIVISMACTTAVSISFEGKKVWLMKTLPISNKDFYNSKLLIYFTIVIPGVIVYLISLFALKIDFLAKTTSLLILLSNIIFIGLLGIRINLKFLNYNWESEVKLVKQSINTLIIIIVAFVINFISGGLTIYFQSFAEAIKIIVIFTLIILSVILYKKNIKINY